ncbi:hypothetical protein RQP46_005230 [Phenoliferia psychrophenolica]
MKMDQQDKAEKGSDSDVDVRYTTTAVAPVLYDPSKESVWTRMGLSWESYKRAPGATGGQRVAGTAGNDGLGEGENPMLQQKMKPRHLQMIAVGGSIGTGLFVGSGQALRNGGPAGVLIAWTLIGMVWHHFAIMLILHKLTGMAMGWNYLLQWAVVLPLEITVAGITVQYWEKAAAVPIAAWITIFFVAIIIVNIFGAIGFAEEEFWSSCLKLSVVIIFVILGAVLNAGGGPASGNFSSYVGGKNFVDPGGFANGFKGVCAVFVTAAFSFAGTELVGLAATETPDPRATMPGAVKGTFWRITLIYLSSLLIIGLNVPYNDPALLDGSGTGTSPFVIMVRSAGINGLDHLINITICISVLSIGLSCVYAGSRVLTALAEQGYAPKIFTYVDKSGRPLFSVLAILAWGPIAYVNVTPSGGAIFDWLLAISGLSTLFTWGAICMCHIRFRAAWKAQGHSVEELPFKAMGGVWGSWFGVILVSLVLIAQFYIAVSYLAAPVMLGFWLAAFIWKRSWPRKASEIDIDTGRKSWLTVEEMRLYRAERRCAPWYIRLRETSLESADTLTRIIKARLATATGIKHALTDKVTSGTALRDSRDAEEFYSQLTKSTKGISHDQVAGDVLGIMIPIAGNLTQQVSLIVELYLRPEDSVSEELLYRFIIEAMRISPIVVGLPRVAKENVNYRDGRNEVKLKTGDIVIIGTSAAHLDEKKFPEPYRVKLDRDLSDYFLLGEGLHSCFGDGLTKSFLTASIRAIFKLNNIRKDPSPTGSFKRAEVNFADGHKSYIYLDDQCNETPAAQSLTLLWDAETKAAAVGPAAVAGFQW